MSDFIEASLSQLIDRGVPTELAQQVVEILEAQNRGELPCPLEGDELAVVNEAWAISMEVWTIATGEER